MGGNGAFRSPRGRGRLPAGPVAGVNAIRTGGLSEGGYLEGGWVLVFHGKREEREGDEGEEERRKKRAAKASGRGSSRGEMEKACGNGILNFPGCCC